MTNVFLWLAIAEVVIFGVLFYRLGRGPTVADRVVAVNAMSTQVTLALLCVAAYAQRTVYLDVALWTASFSYLGTFIWARLVERELL